MRKYTLLIILLLLIVSCGEKAGGEFQLSQIESLIETHPDSARTLLMNLEGNVPHFSRANRMKYILLLTEINDKYSIDCTFDSLMLDVTDYYERHGTPIQQMKSYYLLGKMYNNMQLTGQAVSFLKKALNMECKDDTSTYLIRACAGNQIGNTYMTLHKGLYKEALPYFYKSYYYAQLAKNDSITILALKNIGKDLCQQGQLKKGMIYYRDATEVAQKAGLKRLYKIVMCELADYYRKDKEYDKAKEALILGQGLSDAADLYPAYISWGNYYRTINKVDSAIYYYNKCIQSTDISIVQKAMSSLSDIYAGKKDYKQALHCSEKYAVNADFLNTKASINNRSFVKVLNNKMLIEQENHSLKEKEITFYLIGTVILAVFILLIFITYNYIRNKKLQYKNQEERIKRVMLVMEQNSEQRMRENSQRIKDLEVQLSSSQVQNNQLQKLLIESEKKSLQQENSRIVAEHEKQDLLQQQLRSSDIFKRFYQLARSGQKASTDDFRQLEKLIGEVYNSFRDRLLELYPSINEKELRVCELIKIGLTPSQISDLIVSSNSGISMIRQRLYLKIFQVKGKPEDFDKKILEL